MEKQIMRAKDVKVGMWLVYSNPNFNERVIGVEKDHGVYKISCSRFDDSPVTVGEFDADEELAVSVNIV